MCLLKCASSLGNIQDQSTFSFLFSVHVLAIILSLRLFVIKFSVFFIPYSSTEICTRFFVDP